MKERFVKNTKVVSILISLLMVISSISFPTLNVKAAGMVDDFVERCYMVTLGRGSEPGGFAYWKGLLTDGKSVGTNVAYGFLFSQEYTNKRKNNKDYVTDLYHLFMGREPDANGYNYWMSQLNSGKSREEIFAGFANSQEFYNICSSYGITAGWYKVGYDINQVNNVNLFVERLYKTCLGRIGDMGGQKNWVEMLLNKQISGSECARSFIQSDEYEALGLNDADYVENLYLALMGRTSDASGKTGWLNALENGMTRDEVFSGFVNSSEFASICNTYKINKGTYTAKNKGTNGNNNNQNKPQYKVGDVVLFGKFEQDGNLSNGAEDIEWEILSVENGRILVISKYGLINKRYNEEQMDVTWETCTLRNWLNNDFYNTSFSDKEKKQIPYVTLINRKNPIYGTPGGNTTIDKVFCLSYEDVEKYFGKYNEYYSEDLTGYNQNLICTATPYAIDKGTYYREFTSETYVYFGYTGYSKDLIGVLGIEWWLRNSGSRPTSACYVDYLGQAGACKYGRVSVGSRAVRPAMYIKY